MADAPPLVSLLRYGSLHLTGRFRAGPGAMRKGDRWVIRTERGVEVGQVVAEPEPAAPEAPVEGEALRPLDEADRVRVRELERKAREEDFAFCEERISARGLPMRLVHVEHLFGGGRSLFYFVADGRVDFRELVKDLARHFQSRIELRQIGVRDEARILGDQEYCGRDLCCIAWMRDIQPVTMRMAKNQKSTLDPSKISGRCGRLKCCLRYEDEVYAGLRSLLPRVGRAVQTDHGPGRVVSVDAIAGLVTVELANQVRMDLPAASLRPPEGVSAAEEE